MTPKKVLIIEEDALLLRILETRIKNILHEEVLTAVEMREGLEKLRDENVNLLIIDLFLNNESTLESIKKIKTDPKTKSLPIVIITAIGDKENELMAKTLGVKHFIQKGNTSIREALSMINTALHGV